MKSADLTGLDAFAEVARRRSFRAAAAARGVSASTLSLAVRDLEARLGVRLLNRTTRSVAPTEAGTRLLERLDPALSEIAEAVEAALDQADTPAGLLRINAPVPAIDLVLAPLVVGFMQAFPQVRVEVEPDSRLVDIVAEGFHAGVRWGESLAQDMIAVPLGGAQRYVLTAAPALLKAHGTPRHPKDLLLAPCIRHRFPSGAMPAWEFERHGRTLKIDPPARLVALTLSLQRQAALEGLGFWATFDGYAAEDLAAGRLVSVLDEWLPSFPGPFLYYPSRRHVPAALRAFIDFARDASRRSAMAPSAASPE